VAAALVAQVLALTSSLSGTVVDPQHLPVPGARVEVVCGAHRRTGETDQRGRFTIEMTSISGECRVLVTRQGFARFESRVGAAADVGPIRLRVADLAEQVTVVPEKTSTRSIGSVVLAGSDLRAFAGTTADLVRYARLLAGGTMQPGVIYLDGLPATTLPPLAAIASISVNADPFSPERSDGDVASIDIVTRVPARTFKLHAGGDVLGIGGGDALASDARAASAFHNIGVAGAVPHLPLTFAANASFGGTSRDVPIRAAVPGAGLTRGTATSRSDNWSGTLRMYVAPGGPLNARFSYRESHADAVNLGAGGIVLPEAASSSSFVTRDARASLTGTAARRLYEGTFLVSRSQWDGQANTGGAGVMVPGDVVMGGASITAGRTRHTGWMSKHVLRGTTVKSWTAGVTLSGTDDADAQTPNPAGLYEFTDLDAYVRALAGDRTATWFVTRGNGSVHRSDMRVAPFVQKPLVVADQIELVAGARADFQTGFGAVISPRLSIAARGRGMLVRAGAGLFVKDVPSTILVFALKNDGQHLQQFMGLDLPLAGAGEDGLTLQTRIRSGLAADLAPPRELMARVSVERPVGRLVPGLEYTWTRARNLLGSERRADGTGWLDLVESHRAAERHRVHAQLQYAWRGRFVSAQYEWVRARDNTDGLFSFAEQAGNLAAEWARSAGLAAHSFTAMGSSTLPGSTSLNASYTWRSTAPYNITTGLDPGRSGLFLDRGGRARNSGDAPGYRSLDVYAYRRIQLPNVWPKAGWRLHVNLGVQAQNILGDRNYLSIGSVVGATNFGRPLAAFPGRSVKLSLQID